MALISIIGRPNTGKSTLFNAMIGKRQAVVHNTPNLTRDRHYAQYEWRDRTFTLIDTGGIEEGSDAPFIKLVEQQADIAINESDAIIFLVDNRAGINPDDRYIASKLRASAKTVILAVNKCDEPDTIPDPDIYKLGFDNIMTVSAEHKLNTDRLKEMVYSNTKLGKRREQEGIKFAVIGKPNVGKSSFINGLINDERMIVSDIPGTTRDSVDTYMNYQKQLLVLIDTAGIRRMARINEPTEYYTILRSRLAVKRADVVIVIIDSTEGVTHQDKKILSEAMDSLKPVIIAVNKTDALEDAKEEQYKEIRDKLDFADFMPIVFISAKNRRNLPKVIDKALEMYNMLPMEFPKRDLNTMLFEIVSKVKHPIVNRRRPRFYRMYQVTSNPVRFVIEASRPSGIDSNYKRYIMNSVRRELNLINLNFVINYREKSR